MFLRILKRFEFTASNFSDQEFLLWLTCVKSLGLVQMRNSFRNLAALFKSQTNPKSALSF